MSAKAISRIAILMAVIGLVGGCVNTIRGMGQDTANAVNATQRAADDVADATY